jgi:mannose-6-phosphate isomerase-like protein (cupin superfamily)
MANKNTSSISTFEELIAPTQSEDFFREHWRRCHLHINDSSSSCFASVFALTDLDLLFNASAGVADDWFFYRSIDRVERSTYLTSDGQVQLNRIYALYREGGTIHLRNLQRYLPAIEKLWRSLSHYFHTQVRINLWATSSNEFTPFIHYDTHDIFILQVHGRKQWTLYQRNPKLYAPRSGSTSLDRQDVGVPVHTIPLTAGDILYVPAGQPHCVTTMDPHSIHLAIGVYPVLWRDVLEGALIDLDRRGNSLTEVVPNDLLRLTTGEALLAALGERLHCASQEIDGAALLSHLESRFIFAVPAPEDGHFAREILAAAPVHSATSLRRRANAPALVTLDTDAELARILFPSGGHVEGPSTLATTLRAIATAEGAFCAESLPDEFDIASRILLLDELLRRGLLERASNKDEKWC